MSIKRIFVQDKACIFSVLFAVAFVLFLQTGAGAHDLPTNVNIGENEIGTPPAGFDLLPSGNGKQGQWKVVHDPTASASIAIEQAGVEAANDRFPLAIYKTASPKDVEVSLRLKATGGKEDRGGGVALRLISPYNYYLVQLDALRDRVLFSRVINGVFEEVAGVDADIAPRRWHTLEVRARDNEFLVSLDGTWMFTVFDKALPNAGRFALWTKGDSVTRFDSITIMPLTVLEQRY